MLTEERRKQLDDIVLRMINEGEPEENIKLVVEDFKKKYEVKGYTTEELKETKPKITLDEILESYLLRPIEAAGIPFQALDVAYWAGRKALEEGKPPLEQLKEMGRGAIEAAIAPYRPLGVPYPELERPSTVSGVRGIPGFISDILMQPSNIFLLPMLQRFLQRGAEKTLQKGIPLISKYFGEPMMPSVLPKAEELIPPSEKLLPTVIRPAEKEVVYGVGIKKNLPIPIQEIEPPAKPLFEFDISKRPIKIDELMGRELAESRIGKPLKTISLVGQEPNEKLFRLVDKENKIYAELGLKEHPENILEISWINIDKKGIKPDIRRAYRTDTSVEHIEGLYKHIHSNIEKFAKQNNYKIIGASPTIEGKARLEMMGFIDVPQAEVDKFPFSMFKRVEQRVNFTPDFHSRFKTLKIHKEIGFLNAEKAAEINDMALRRSMLFDISPEKEYVFFDLFGNEKIRFKDIKDAENYVKSIKITPSDFWITQQSKFKQAASEYSSIVERDAQRVVNEYQKVPKEYSVEVIGTPTYRKFISTPPPKVEEKFARERIYEGVEYRIKPTVTLTKETKTEEAIKSVDGIYDTGEGEIVALVGKKGSIPLRESAVSILKSVVDIPSTFYERVITLKGWLKPAQYFFEQQPNPKVKEFFYRRLMYADKNTVIETKNLLEENRKIIKELKLTKKDLETVGIYALSRDDIGHLTLQLMKKKIPTELTPNQMTYYTFVRRNFENLFKRINEARNFIGLEPIGYVGDYVTFFRNYDELEKLGYFWSIPDLMEVYNNFVKKSSTVFRFEKERVKSFIPFETVNLSEIFERYSKSAIRHINFTPAIGINRASMETIKDISTGTTFSIKENAPRFYAWMTKYLNDLAGQKQATELPRWLEKTLGELNSNVVTAMLSGNIRSFLIQPTQLLLSVIELSPKYFMKGFIDWLTNSEVMQEISKLSNHLVARQYDVSVAEAFKMVKEPGLFTSLVEALTGTVMPKMRKVSRVYKGTKSVLAKTGFNPLGFFDQQSARITAAGAYRKAKEYYKLSGQEAVNFADDVVIKTQVSARLQDLPAAQRTAIGKTLFTLQTFVIGQWNYLAKEIAGISNPKIKSKEAFERIMKYLIGVAVINTFFEDVLGTYSPFPTPIKAYKRKLEKTRNVPSAIWESTTELVEIIPGVGGVLRYGSHIGGPLLETLGAGGRKVSGRIEYKTPLEIAGLLFGVPFTSQMKKIYTGKKYGAGEIETWLGMREPPQKRPKRSGRGKRE